MLHRRRWEDNIKVNLKEIEWDGAEFYFAQDTNSWWALVYTVMKHRVHKMRRMSWLDERVLILGFRGG
jgi:hypothetical protein